MSTFPRWVLEFAEDFGEFSPWHNSYTWKKLEFAAEHVGHD
jgi:hypothetical protein